MYIWNQNILPLPSHNFGIDADSATIRSKMDSGRARQRPRYTEHLKGSTLIFELTKAEYALFVLLFEVELNMGADWFSIPLPMPYGNTLTPSTVRFIGGYGSQHSNFENWTVTTTIEYQKSKTELTQAMFDIVNSEGYDTSQFEISVASLQSELAHFNQHHSFT